MLVSVDVLEGAVVTFDSYPKIDGSRKSEYGELVNGDDSNNSGTKYTIYYNEGIRLEHAIASGSVPINYDYTKIEADRLTIDILGNKKMDKVERYFWDGGIASNTPLRELIQAHKDYWLDVRGIGKEDGQSIPDLEVIIVDVWPTRRENIPLDHDGELNRNYDLLACDKTDYDEKVANMVSDYIKVAKDLIGLAKSNKISKEKIEAVLSQPAKSRHRSNLGRTFHDLMEGRFGVDIKRILNTLHLSQYSPVNSSTVLTTAFRKTRYN